MNAPRKRLAVIDVGTNSVKLIVASVNNGRVEPHHFSRVATRLGRGLASTGRISNTAARQTAATVRKMAGQARAHGADDIVAVGTYAFRTASNGRTMARAMSGSTGIPMRILTGADEARLVLASIHGRLRNSRRYLMVVDVGGGSAQLIVARGPQTLLSRSVPLGAVVLTERHVHTDPVDAGEYEQLCAAIERVVSRLFTKIPALPPASVSLVVVGGAATTAAAMTGAALREGVCTLSLAKLKELNTRVLAATVSGRRRMRGMQPDRADIMPAGLAVLLAFARHAGVRSVKVSAGGWRDGLILSRAQRSARSPAKKRSTARSKAAARKGR